MLVVGLGNPGEKYTTTRHNVGFMLLDQLARKYDLAWSFNKKINAEIATYFSTHDVGKNKVILLKPQTFVNESGTAVKAAMNFFNISMQDLLVVHDDLDFDFGTVKKVKDRSDAGHNGVKSITKYLGSSDYGRLRFGIGRPEDSRINSVDYVLGNFTDKELRAVKEYDLEPIIASNLY
ncbi:aminoacyl-tRNA hydrolase [Candidatus Nomurabacteria bacterium]|uniref:Peptidyl-tRNA hydrolase n=1 Tax=candidate division WWE3 bacterium TaxID=2053526 RepID=A0A955IW05_UNCKA|nr:aminoacyl-tRNA hydrolase [candidate division WWE3 bacterium]MCB9823664.1 aminoacyl-tRNA hydrolase [Candidatus Nomurabacteria bacterium]MCB9827258.1 aminoacyl-tRNA hydrolase [Candidatus Nomurabacteria bacterium]MCB9827459.1 aminoacyl-tRNA hydrolase [Candidatus Nomurabacteria bacterium]